MKGLISIGPLRILEKSSRRGLGPGNMGVLIARAGVGKTACLIHFALDKIFRQERLVHVSLKEHPEKVTSYYDVICHDLIKTLNIKDDSEYRTFIDKNRMILAYLNHSFDLRRLQANLKNLTEQLQFRPDALIVDGLDFEGAERELFEGLKALAQEASLEIWLSALSHRHITETNDRGIPHPCDELDDLFSVILHLKPETSGLYLTLLKDHGAPKTPHKSLRLDPNTFLALDEE